MKVKFRDFECCTETARKWPVEKVSDLLGIGQWNTVIEPESNSVDQMKDFGCCSEIARNRPVEHDIDAIRIEPER